MSSFLWLSGSNETHDLSTGRSADSAELNHSSLHFSSKGSEVIFRAEDGKDACSGSCMDDCTEATMACMYKLLAFIR